MNDLNNILRKFVELHHSVRLNYKVTNHIPDEIINKYLFNYFYLFNLITDSELSLESKNKLKIRVTILAAEIFPFIRNFKQSINNLLPLKSLEITQSDPNIIIKVINQQGLKYIYETKKWV